MKKIVDQSFMDKIRLEKEELRKKMEQEERRRTTKAASEEPQKGEGEAPANKSNAFDVDEPFALFPTATALDKLEEKDEPLVTIESPKS